MSTPVDSQLFRNALGNLDYGSTENDINEKMAECIEAAKKTGKKSELVIKLTIVPEGAGDVSQVTIVGDINAKLPRLPRRKTIFFTTSKELLTRIDPRQNEIPSIRVVEDDRPKEFKTVNN